MDCIKDPVGLYLMMTMTTRMWKRTKKIRADTLVTVAKPLLSSGVALRNHNAKELNTNLDRS